LNDLDSETSILTDSYSDSGSDTNSNSIYEYLIINIGLDIKESGTYFIELELQDQYNNYVKKLKNVYTLSTGERNIDFTIEGKGIYSTKINGPYIIESINLLKDNEIIDSASKTYTTSEYNSDDFEKPPLPDLEITDVEIQDNLVTVEIENTGSSYAFSFIVELFDEDFNSVGKKIVSYLAPSSSETLTYEIDTSSISILTAIIDYLNTIEESNEANNILVKSTEPPYQLNLQQGWNLISLPVKPLNNLISSIFSNDLLPLFSYDNLNSKWITYQSESSNNFDQVSEQSGIWVKSATTQSIEIDATDLTYPIEFSLKQGWNLVSYPAENTVSADTALNNVKSTISSVLTYKDGNWISYSPSKPSSLNTLPNLEPGRAYWIYIHQGATWTFDGSSYT
ncbi:MAG: CARDB domain-containing protein, partial [Nanoarchaeota archaeon]|nr:CARDB domain-containing protein [Nanoarchaeota archaeon]